MRHPKLGCVLVAAVSLLWSASALAVVPPALQEMKQARDAIYQNIPGTWANRLAVLKAVTARRSNAATWEQNKLRADELWTQWRPVYDDLAAGRPNAYNAENLAADSRRMKLCGEKFRTVRELLIDHGLAGVKKQLAYQLYLVENPAPALNAQDQQDLGMNDDFYLDQVDEALAAYKGRVKARIRAYLRPGEAGWFRVAGYGAFAQDPYIHGVGALDGTPIHWTLYRGNLGALAGLQVGTTAIDTIIGALVPNGGELVGVHVTLERYGQNSVNNPRVFGRPANTGRRANAGNLPDGVTLDDMADRLDAENGRRVQRIRDFVDRRTAHIRAGWADR